MPLQSNSSHKTFWRIKFVFCWAIIIESVPYYGYSSQTSQGFLFGVSPLPTGWYVSCKRNSYRGLSFAGTVLERMCCINFKPWRCNRVYLTIISHWTNSGVSLSCVHVPGETIHQRCRLCSVGVLLYADTRYYFSQYVILNWNPYFNVVLDASESLKFGFFKQIKLVDEGPWPIFSYGRGEGCANRVMNTAFNVSC